MVQYGTFESETIKTNSGKDNQERSFISHLRYFITECECVARTNEGFILYLVDGNSIKIDLIEVKKIGFGADYLCISFLEDSMRTIVVRYSAILFFEILPTNSETCKLG